MLRCSANNSLAALSMSTHLRAARLTSVKATARTLLQRADAQKRYYTDRPRPSSRPTRSLGRFVLYSVSAFLGAHVFARYFYYCDATYGVSMLPTIQSFGDWVVVSKYYRRGRGVQVGDIVSFKHPAREGEFAIKRVIGMGGDFVLMNTPEHSDAMIQVSKTTRMAMLGKQGRLTQLVGSSRTLLGGRRQYEAFARFSHVWSLAVSSHTRQSHHEVELDGHLAKHLTIRTWIAPCRTRQRARLKYRGPSEGERPAEMNARRTLRL